MENTDDHSKLTDLQGGSTFRYKCEICGKFEVEKTNFLICTPCKEGIHILIMAGIDKQKEILDIIQKNKESGLYDV